jgi:hypothetical protein
MKTFTEQEIINRAPPIPWTYYETDRNNYWIYVDTNTYVRMNKAGELTDKFRPTKRLRLRSDIEKIAEMSAGVESLQRSVENLLYANTKVT